VGIVLSTEPDNDTARRLKSLIALKQGNVNDIITLLEPSIDSAGRDSWPIAMTAKAAILNGQTQLGEQTILGFLDSGNQADQDLKAAQRALADSQIDAALTHLDSYLTRPLTKRGAQRIENALQYLQQGQWDMAEAETDRLLDLAPREALAHHLTALVNLGKGYPDEAQAILEYSIRLNPDFTPSLVALGRLYLTNKDFDMAMKVSAALRRAAPNKPLGYALEGDVRLAQNDHGAAIAAYQKALNKAGSRLAIKNLSRRLVGLAQPDKVIDKLGDWIDTHPDDLELRIFLALQLQVERQTNAAMGHYRLALKQNHDQLVALNELAVWQQRQGQLGEAIGLAERAYALAPANPVIIDTLGWIRLSQDRMAAARELLDRAVGELRGVPVAHYHYGVLLARTNRPSEARGELETALANSKPSYWIADAQRWLRKLPVQIAETSNMTSAGIDPPATAQAVND